MDEARAVVADFCRANPYLLGALPMTWFGCGPFARMVVTFVIYEIRRVVVRALAIADSKDAKPYVEFLMDTWRLWPIRVVLWALTMALVLWPFMLAAELAVENFVASMVHNLEILMALTSAIKIPRKYSWPLKAMAIALRGTLGSVTASAPLVAWGAIFFATQEPFKLASPDAKKSVKAVLFAPVHILLNVVRGKPVFGEKKKEKEDPPVAAAPAPAAPTISDDAAATKLQSAVRAKNARDEKTRKDAQKGGWWPWSAKPLPEPTERTKPAPDFVVYVLLAGWFGLAVFLNRGLATQVGQTLGSEAVKEAVKAEARMKLGL
mmetsp:Transcript_2990/g.8894  ORF Transcript_2990/g.8894 Transcript_2990/m.8894 type:complete len:321 (-) Transcript_2990:15-977(-)